MKTAADQPRLTPKLRFPKFRDAEGWHTLPGNEVFDQISNREAPAGLPILAITQEYGAIPRDDIDYHVSVTDKSIETYKEVLPGDFIISLRSFQGGIEYSEYHGICSPAYIILRKRIELENLFYKHLFKSHSFILQLTKNLEGLRDGKMISYAQFSELQLPSPSLPEQHRIAVCLSSLDDLIGTENRKLDALKAHKKGLLRDLFTREGETRPRLRFPEFRDAGEWISQPLSLVAENLDSIRIPITEKDRKRGDIPYYGASGVVDHVKGYIFNEDLLCVSEDGANLVARTYPIAFSISGKTWVNNHAHVLRFQNISTQKLVEDYINCIDLTDYITGMAQPKLNKSMLGNITIPLPTQAEQHRIASCLSSLDDLIAAQTDKIEALKIHKKGLMQQLFPAQEEEA